MKMHARAVCMAIALSASSWAGAQAASMYSRLADPASFVHIVMPVVAAGLTDINARTLRVPYTRSAQSANDFLAGQLDLHSHSTTAPLPLMKSGEVQVIANNVLRHSPRS